MFYVNHRSKRVGLATNKKDIFVRVFLKASLSSVLRGSDPDTGCPRKNATQNSKTTFAASYYDLSNLNIEFFFCIDYFASFIHNYDGIPS